MMSFGFSPGEAAIRGRGDGQRLGRGLLCGGQLPQPQENLSTSAKQFNVIEIQAARPCQIQTLFPGSFRGRQIADVPEDTGANEMQQAQVLHRTGVQYPTGSLINQSSTAWDVALPSRGFSRQNRAPAPVSFPAQVLIERG